MLLHSWTRRKRFEARLLASELGKLLTPPRPFPGRGGGRVAPDEMMEMLGIKL
jgi:hypothetical protein